MKNGTSFGGFNYAFFDSNGNNVNSKVNLCILSGNTYTKITYTAGTEGYYNVRTESYNNQALYIVTQDNTLNIVTMKIQENSFECTATVYEIKGTYSTGGHYNYCMTCQDRFDSATTSASTAVSSNVLYKHNNGNYYKYSYSKGVTGNNFDWYLIEGSSTPFAYGSSATFVTTGYNVNGTISYKSSALAALRDVRIKCYYG